MIRTKVLAGVFLSYLLMTNIYAADLLPLAPGNAWTYRDAVTGESFNVQVGTQVLINDRLYHTLRGYVKELLLVRVNEYGNIVYWDEEKAQDVLLISFEAVPRAWWEAPKRECPQEGQTSGARRSHEGPAGRWDALDIQFRTSGCADIGDESEQFVENVGMVRRVVTSFAGPRTFDLVYARIGTQVISAGNVGSFKVTALDSRSPGFWTVTLRIELPAGTAIKVNFPSSQEYDARLRDSDGRILWSWSADKLFLQAQHARVIQGGVLAVLEVPQPPAVPEGQHAYTIEAWVTTGRNEPAFAAVTGVTVP